MSNAIDSNQICYCGCIKQAKNILPTLNQEHTLDWHCQFFEISTACRECANEEATTEKKEKKRTKSSACVFIRTVCVQATIYKRYKHKYKHNMPHSFNSFHTGSLIPTKTYTYEYLIRNASMFVFDILCSCLVCE